MTILNRTTSHLAIVFFTLMMVTSSAGRVQAGGCLLGKKCHKTTCCPQCDHACTTCHLEAEMVDVDKKCFEVETKLICIPRVVFPWQKKRSSCHSCDACDGHGCSACLHRGAKTRKIKVLKTKKYKCPECQYTWTPEEQTSSCCDHGDMAGWDAVDFSTGDDEGLVYEQAMPYGIPQPVDSNESIQWQSTTESELGPIEIQPLD